MSITLTREMFSMLSKKSRDEILDLFTNSASMTVRELLRSKVDVAAPLVGVAPHQNSDTTSITAFESASLTFGKPLVLPSYRVAELDNNDVMAEPIVQEVVCQEEPVVQEAVCQEEPVIRVAKNYPVAKPTDLYSIAPLKDIQRICREIDNGLFVSNSKSAIWSEGGRYHHMNWDVKKVFITVKSIQPATSLQIDHSLPTMDRYRVSAILRELRKQGLLIVT